MTKTNQSDMPLLIVILISLSACGGEAPPRKPALTRADSVDASAATPVETDASPATTDENSANTTEIEKSKATKESLSIDESTVVNSDPQRLAYVQQEFAAAVISNRKVKFTLGSTQMEQLVNMRSERTMQVKLFGPYAAPADVPSTYDVGINVDNIVITIDNASFKDFTFDAATGVVTFLQVPANTTKIIIRYEQIGAAVLKYAVKIPANATNLIARDIVSGQSIAIALTAESVSFSAQEFSDGKKIRILYQDPNRGLDKLTLPDAPIPNSLTINGGQSVCENNGKIVISDKDINLAECSIKADIASIDADYLFVESMTSTFAMTISGAKKGGQQTWKVFVDDVPSTSHTLKDNTVTFGSPLAYDATVKIVVEYEMMEVI